MLNSEERIVNGGIIEEDVVAEPGLRPRTLCEYVGQSKVKDNLNVYIEAAKTAKKLSTMYCFMDLPDLEKQLLLTLLQMNLV